MLPSDDYDLYSDTILDRIRGSKEDFRRCMTGNYVVIAREYGCEVSLSQSRLNDAQELWNDDLEALLHRGTDGSKSLDQFKVSAFLTFWLRRCKPINAQFGDRRDLGLSTEDQRAARAWFNLYCNEICALRVGANLCQAYCIRSVNRAQDGSARRVTKIRSTVTKQVTPRYVSVSPDFEADFVMMLKHKNNSPHSINLIFEALFGGLGTRAVSTAG